MSKKKSRGQQLYESFRSSEPGKCGVTMLQWNDTWECVREMYERAAKKIYAKWYRAFKNQAINEALKGK